MAITTKDPHTWLVIEDQKSGKKMEIFNDETPNHDFTIPFEVNFSDAATPAVNTVTLYNISKAHASFPKKGMKIYLYFNWGSSKKLICEGFVTKDDSIHHDGVTDSKVISFTEGTNYSNVKANRLKVEKSKTVHKSKIIKVTEKGHYENKRVSVPSVETYKRGPHKGEKHTVNHWHTKQVWVPAKTKNKRVPYRETKTARSNKTYKKGTTYKALIQGIANQCGIKIDRIQLHKNPKLTRPYTAKGKPLTLIKQLVQKTESIINYRKGKFEIIDPKAEKRTWIDIDDQDLVQPPSNNEADNGKETWEITTPLIPDVTVGVGINMKSKYLKGRFYVKAGQHTSDGENPQTQCSLAAM